MLELVTTDRGQRDDAEGVETAATLESLLLQVAQGDAQSFSELYDRTAARVLGLVRRVLVDHSQSE